VEPDRPHLPIGGGWHDPQLDPVPVGARGHDPDLLERRAKQPLHASVSTKAALEPFDLPLVRRRREELLTLTRHLEEGGHLLEDEQVPPEDQIAAPLLVERCREHVDAGGQEDSAAPAPTSCLGVSFSGSMNGFLTTTAPTVSSGFSISSSVPSSECSVGTIA
jgi:hypothetical protein